MMNKNWYALPWKSVVKELGSNAEKGLSKRKAQILLEEHGPNTLPEAKSTPRIVIFLQQFTSPLIFILAIAGVVTIILGEYTDGTVIWAAVLLNTFIGYFQENKATRALDVLSKVIKVNAKVIRDDNEIVVPQENLVPGDIIVLSSGDKIPADARVIESWNLKANEAPLTGEWIPADKNEKPVKDKTPLADRDGMVYMGTVIEGGSGRAVVTGTGEQTEIGQVAVLVEEVEKEKTPYQLKLSRFSWVMASIIGVIAILIFIEGILTGGTLLEMFLVTVAVAVAAIPEGLPVAMTAILAVGMQRILRQSGLVRKLTSAETLGSSSIIATDKTLTLTEGKMEVQEVFVLESDRKNDIYQIIGLANESFVENPDKPFEKWIIRGNPTDKALFRAAIDSGFSRKEFEKKSPIIRRETFDPIKKYITSFHQLDGGVLAFVSGAPENLMRISKNLSGKKLKNLEEKLDQLTEQGLRVVAAGMKKIKKLPDGDVKDIDFIGLVAMRDPLRPGVKKAIKLARKAGIETIMVTGDHVKTARAVAREVGIFEEDGAVIEGSELERLSDNELKERLETIRVYARVEPKHKLKIVDAWQARGEVIAMTGDGINDAPAIRRADIGIALGSGTDVAKEVADLVLLGDKFSIIPAAIREGRIIVDNIRKVITYLMSSTFTEIILIGTSLLFGLPLPVTAVQILWINLVEDGLPGIAFTFEEGEKDVMGRKPEKKDKPLLTSEMKSIIFIIGVTTNAVLMGLFLILLNFTDYTIEHIRTFMFIGLGIDSLFFVFSCKNLHKNIWQYNLFSNKYLIGSVIIGTALLVAAVYMPFLQAFLDTVYLNLTDWTVLISFGLLNIALIEATKWSFIRKDASLIGLES